MEDITENKIDWTKEKISELVKVCQNMNTEYNKMENIFRTDLLTGRQFCSSLVQQGKLPMSVFVKVSSEIAF